MKKTLAILLSLALVICMIPATAFAEATSLNGQVSLSETSSYYDGSVKNPTVNVSVSGADRDTDYTVVWSKGGVTVSEIKDAGKYTVTVSAVSGSQKCTGEGTAEYTVEPITISNENTTIELEDGSLVYNGKEHKPAVKSVVVSGKTLTPGSDYTVTYLNNIAGGPATVTVTGKGNYKNSATKTFTISPFALNGTNVKVYVGSQISTVTSETIKRENNDF